MGLGTINVGWGGSGGGGRTSVTFGLGESKKQQKKELHGSDCLAFLCFLYPVVFFLCLKVLGLYSAIDTSVHFCGVMSSHLKLLLTL